MKSSGKIALIGFMGCGKSRIGKILAPALDLPFMDQDDYISRETGMSIPDFFQRFGEIRFRELEEKTLADIGAGVSGCVLACGGGVVLSVKNRKVLDEKFFTVWIDVPAEELLRRLENERYERPLLSEADYKSRIVSLLEARRPLYRESADMVYEWIPGYTPGLSARKISERLADRQ